MVFQQGLVLGLSGAPRVLVVVLFFSFSVSPASLFCPVKFIFAICFELENKLSLSVVWIYPGFLTVASVFGEASRWFVVGDECIKRTENL